MKLVGMIALLFVGFVNPIAVLAEEPTGDRHMKFAARLHDFADMTEEVAGLMTKLPGGRKAKKSGLEASEQINKLADIIEKNPLVPFTPEMRGFKTSLMELIDTIDTYGSVIATTERDKRLLENYQDLAQELVDRINAELKIQRGESFRSSRLKDAA